MYAFTRYDFQDTVCPKLQRSAKAALSYRRQPSGHVIETCASSKYLSSVNCSTPADIIHQQY